MAYFMQEQYPSQDFNLENFYTQTLRKTQGTEHFKVRNQELTYNSNCCILIS